MKKSNKILIICLVAVAVLLAVSTVYFIGKSREPAILIRIGIPHGNQTSDTLGAHYSEPLKSEGEVNTILLSMINAYDIPAENDIAGPADAVLMIVDTDGMGYFYYFWLGEDYVIFSQVAKAPPQYRAISGSGNIAEIKQIIESWIDQ